MSVGAKMHLTLIMRIILACLSLIAVYTKYYLSIRNGFIPMLATLKAQNMLPGGEGQLRARYTMCDPVDNFLTACTLFFWPALNGSSSPLSIYGLAFAGAMVPAWIIVAGQTRRSKNVPGSLVGNLVLGLAIQCIGPGVVVPAFLVMKPLTLAGVHCRTPSHCIYLPMLVFYALPLLLASGAGPDSISIGMKQQLIGLWQGWPVYVSLSLHILQFPKLTTALGASEVFQRRVHIYIFAFACSAVPHLALLKILADPSATCNEKSVIMPRLFWGAEKVTSVEQGVLHFLQWDYTISAVAILIWCVVLFCRHNAAMQRMTLAGDLRLLLRVLALAAGFGPCSAAVVLYYQAEDFALCKDA